MNSNELNELKYVEEPFLKQLEGLGWKVTKGDKYDPSVSLRDGFNEVVLESELRKSIKNINPWIEDDQINEVVHEITVPRSNNLIEANQEVLNLLLENTSVSQNRQTGEKSPTVKFIEFKNPQENSFLAISQFKVQIPGTEKHIIPDIVLFINGLPIGVVECKSPYISDPIAEGITQLMRYSNKRGKIEGNEKLFYYNQFMISTCRQVCKYSTISGKFEHYLEWKDPYPYTLSDINTEGSKSVNSQQVLIKGVFTKDNILDIIQNFTIFQEDSNHKLIKIVGRYQQYRAVQKIIERLKSNKTPSEKSGIVWHTQGSGKSLTMMFTVRKMNRETDLKKYKVVFITDRNSLQKQLIGASQGIGYSLKKATSIKKLKNFLKTNTPDLIMGMIQKFQEREFQHDFPVLNTSENILVMIDEAHRGQYKWLGANLHKSLPNSAKIAYTGTPIDKTEKTFGDYIDKYTIDQSVEDGVTVEIIYEGRTQKGEITDKQSMDKRFEDVFKGLDSDSRQLIMGRYTWQAYLEAKEVIADKAKDMMKHYITHIFPNKFKAQVVTVSRLAAIRYKKALDKELNRIIKECEKEKEFNGVKVDIDQLKKMEIATVISGTPNDPPEFDPYTDKNIQDRNIESFKLPFDADDSDLDGNVGIIVVQSMLITGFDAPIEQVLYLDNVIREHNLLQAIARVNRVHKHKKCGFVIDYVGIANHLRDALSSFKERDINEILKGIKDSSEDIDNLNHSRRELVDFFKKRDIADLSDIDACVDVLVDEKTRFKFLQLYRNFTKNIDQVLPKPEALKYVEDLKLFSFISQSARNRYRDEKLSIKDASNKIRDIVDEFLISKGVDPKVPPLPIFSKKFKAKIKRHKSDKAKASELESGIKKHISRHYGEDPELYERISEKLEKLLKEYEENWELLAKELEKLLDDIQKGREEEQTFGLDPKKEMPYLGLLKRELFNKKSFSDLSEEEIDSLVNTTKDIIGIVEREVNRVDFWEKSISQKRLKNYIASHLLKTFKGNKQIFESRNSLAQQILELAFHLSKKEKI